MTVHCEVETLSAWLDDALEPAEAARVGAHVAECPRCGGELAGLRRVVDRLRALERQAPPPALAIAVGRHVAVARPRHGLAARLAARREEIQPSVGLVFAMVVAFALIGWLTVRGPELRQRRTIPVRFDDATTVAPVSREGEASELGGSRSIAGRRFSWDGVVWRESGVAAAPARQVRIPSPEWERRVGSEPRLSELVALQAPVVLRFEGEVVQLSPAAQAGP